MKITMRLREKFLLPTVLLLLVGMIGLTIVLYIVSRDELLLQSNTQLEDYAERTSGLVETWLSRTIIDLEALAEQEVLATAIPDTFVGRSARSAASEQLTLFQERYQFYRSIQVLDGEGGPVAFSHGSFTDDLSSYSYFQEAVEGRVSSSEVFYSTHYDEYIFVIAVPLLGEEEVLGVLMGCISMDYFGPAMISDVRIGSTGYAFLIDDRNEIIAHPDEAMISETMTQMTGTAITRGSTSGYQEYTYLDRDWILTYHQIPIFGWFIAITQDTGEILAAPGRIGRISLFLAFGITIVVIIVLLFVALKVTRPAGELLLSLERIKEGDLKSSLEIKTSDEFGDLAQGIEAMRENLQELVLAIRRSARETSTTSEELASGTEETNVTIQEVAASVTQFSSTTEQLSLDSQTMADGAEEVNTLAQAGQEQMDKTQLQMEDIIQSAQEASTTIKGLEKSSQEIEDIAGVISSVADQTNLLALNAAIEAARAGEHGQGFAVVADEVRKLAVETQRSVGEIKEIINRLSQSTGEAVTVIDSNNEQITIGAETLRDSGEAFKKIVEKIASINATVQDVASASQELSASSEEISASTEEQSASMEEISSSAESLSAMAQELTSLVEQLSLE